MPVPTDQEILDGLRTAFHAIVLGEAQSYSVNGRTYTSHNISTLETAISAYERRVSSGTRRMFSGGTFRGAR